jgi:signal transduction histidine kinase
MNIHKRFMFHFFGQLVLTMILIVAISLTVFATIGYLVMEEEVSNDLSGASELFLTNNMVVEGEKVIFKDELKELVRKQNGWLLVFTNAGRYLDSYHVPSGLAESYKGMPSVPILLKKTPGTDYQHWSLDLSDSKKYHLLFGKEDPGQILMNQVRSDVQWSDGNLSLSDTTTQNIQKKNGWVQLLDRSGKVVDEYGTKYEPETYLSINLLSLKDKETTISTHVDAASGYTILTGIHETSPEANPSMESFSNGWFILLLILIAVLLSWTFWYARKFGMPLITMMKWIQNLSSGKYQQPYDQHGQAVMTNKKGKLKRKYRLYKDLITNLSLLTDTLNQNERHQKQMVTTREEWISGLSHDLKTPLSSISGYAHMLESDTYSWSKEETKQFARIITEKSSFMMKLIDDLTLTYRLKNQALPIAKEKTDMNELLRRTVIHFINDQANSQIIFHYHPCEEKLHAEVDPKWFQRILDNLLANAVKYNQPGTEVSVSLSSIEQYLIVITIEDNGRGMNKETLDQLFQRYYRGTNTDETSTGSGLGMAITKQLIELHKGSINVNSTAGTGTKVRIMVPK